MEENDAPAGRRPGLRPRRVGLLLLLGALLVGLLFAAATQARRKDARKRGADVPTNTARPAPASLRLVTARAVSSPGETEQLSGDLEARHTVTVSAEVAARIVSRPAERGGRITKGALVATLDDRAARASVAGALAALNGATAARRQAEADYRRAGTETASAIDSAEANLAGAVAGESKARAFTRTQELRQAEAALSQAETDENLACIEHDRYTRLVAEGAVAQQMLDRVRATYDAAKARTRSAHESVSLAKEGARREDIAQAAALVRNARAGLDSARARPARLASIREQIAGYAAQESRAAAALSDARIQLSKHRLLSPVSGRVLETRAEVGEMASPGTPVAVLADVRDLRAVFAVPESARPLLRIGRTATITTDAFPGRSFPARVTLLGFQGDGKTRAFRVEVAVANPGEVLLPNMTARLALCVGAATRVVLVPVSAVATNTVTGGAFVVAVGADGETARRPVTLGEPVGTDLVRVLAGLTGGERLAADPDRVR